MTIKTFAPNGFDDTVQLAASAASARVAIDKNSSVVRVLNAGPDLAYLTFGDGNISATVSKIPLPAGSPELFTKGPAAYAAAICDTGKSALLFFTSGEGI